MRYRINWDWLGISASVICAIHCALLPLLLTSLPLFGINIVHHLGFEWGMIALALVIGSYSMYHGYKKHHHRLTPWLLFLLGGGFLILKQIFPDFQLLLLIPAVALIIYAHLLNVRSCRSHNHAHGDDCRH